MLQPVRCIKFGEILLDENRQLLLLCSNCHSDYDDLHRFRQHMECCGATETTEAPMQGIFGQNVSLIFSNGTPDQQILKRHTNGNKEYLIYKFNGVKKLEALPTKQHYDNEFMDLIKIEEELLDPRWYTQTDDQATESTTNQSSLASYNELVEAVTPFVQFKENVKSYGKQNKVYTLKSPAVNQLPTQIPVKKPKNGIIINDTTPRVYTEKATNRIRRNQGKHLLSVQKQNTTTSTDAANTFVNNNNVVKLPAEVHKVKPIIEPIKINLSSTDGTQQKLPLQRKHQQQVGIESCSSSTTNFVLNNQGQSDVQLLPTRFQSHATVQCNTAPTLNDTNVIKTFSPSSTFHIGSIHSSPSINVNDSFIPAINSPINSLQTEQILNKLQNLGLQVKRKLPNLSQQEQLSSSIRNKTNEKTLELLKKLQSKGMKVKIVQNPSSGQNQALANNAVASKKPRVENASRYQELAHLNSDTNKLSFIWPQ